MSTKKERDEEFNKYLKDKIKERDRESKKQLDEKAQRCYDRARDKLIYPPYYIDLG